MKKTIFSLFALTIGASAFAQSAQEQAIKDNDIKQASITLIPEEQWCIQRRYVDEDGAPDPEKALLNSDALDFVNALEGAAADNGYEFENLLAKLGNGQNIEAINLVNENAQFDIEPIINTMSRGTYSIYYSIDPTPDGAYAIRCKALETATQKVIQARTYVTTDLKNWETNPENKKYIDNLFERINDRYNQMLQQGRICSFIFFVKDGCKLNFFDEVQFEGETGKLYELVDLWLSENAVSTNYRFDKSSDNLMIVRDLMIPAKIIRKKFGRRQRFDGIELIQFFEDSTNPNGLGGLDDLLATLDLTVKIYPVGINGGILIIDNKY